MKTGSDFATLKLPTNGKMVVLAIAAILMAGMLAPEKNASTIWNEVGGFAGALCMLAAIDLWLRKDGLGFLRLLTEGGNAGLGSRARSVAKIFLLYFTTVVLAVYSIYGLTLAADHFTGGGWVETFSAWLKGGETAKGGRTGLFLGPAPIWGIFWTICMAPLLEELFFRRFLYVALRKRLGFTAALAIVSGLFAFIHAPIPLLMLVTCVLGGFLAYFYEKHRDFGANVAFHALNNAVSLGIFWFLR